VNSVLRFVLLQLACTKLSESKNHPQTTTKMHILGHYVGKQYNAIVVSIFCVRFFYSC